MDRVTKEQRSRNMAAIRSRGNATTEAEFAKLLRKHRITGWRRHQKGAYGSPDFIFPKAKIALFADGCFWHGCPRHCIMPKSNKKYWTPKIARNKARDRAVNTRYKAKGWRVLRIWEHEIKKSSERAIQKLLSLLGTV